MTKFQVSLILLGLFVVSNSIDSIHYDIDSCILADMNITVTITNSGDKTITLTNVNNSAGRCSASDETANLLINLENGGSLELTFVRRSNMSYLDQITVRYKSLIATTKQLNQLLSGVDAYYECPYSQSFELDSSVKDSSVTVDVNYMKVQAFEVQNGSYSDQPSVCAPVMSTTTATPPTNVTTATPSSNVTNVTTATLPTNVTTATLPTNVTTVTLPTNVTTATLPTNVTTATPPTNVTTAPGNETTTHTSNSSTSSPTAIPPSPPESKQVTIEVNETGVVCILASFKGTIDVTHRGEKSPEVYHIAKVASTSGSCGDDKQYIAAKLMNNWVLNFTFTKSGKKVGRRLLADVSYYMSNVAVTYIYKGDTMTDSVAPKDKREVNVGQSYKCNAKETIKAEATEVELQDFRVEAFRKSKTKTFSKSVECSADSTHNNTVPIVVGVCLGVLVIVIVIVYLIGRRRQRRLAGYRTMN